jgi:peptidoglycan/LPS O-acetylase OafA/YrhL
MSARFNREMEALRGLAALVVVTGHVTLFQPLLDPSVKTWGIPVQQAHYAVLIFFALSGYVIGLTNRPDPSLARGAWTRRYLARRLVRLYPIYLVAIGLALLVVTETSWSQVLTNLGFGQVLIAPTIDSNPPLWSLDYEVLYYLIFVPIFVFRLNPRSMLVTCVVLACYRYYTNAERISLIASYSAGLCYWMLGLCIAWYLPSTAKVRPPHRVVAYFLLAVTVPVLNIIQPVVAELHIDASGNSVSYFDLFDAASIGFLMLVFANVRETIWLRLLGAAVVVMTFWGWLYAGHHHVYPFGMELQHLGIWTFGLAALFYVVPDRWLSPLVLRALTWVGGVSYALYVLHMPMMLLIARYLPVEGHYYLRVALVFALSLGVGYVLERVLQPRIKRWLLPERRASAAPPSA